jgi:UDP-N-acetylmuramoyl-tripeptide--D-alanyl-D-alanine ligase
VFLEGHSFSYVLPNGGPHWILNSVAIIAAAYALGADINGVCENLRTFVPPAGRGRRYDIKGISIIDDSYNAAYEAVVAAVSSFAQEVSHGRKFVFLGEMSELGDQTEYYHNALYDPLLSLHPDGIWLCGASFESVASKLPSIRGYGLTSQELIPDVLDTLCPGDTLLVKGSRGMKTFAVIEALYRHHGMEEEALSYPLRHYL